MEEKDKNLDDSFLFNEEKQPEFGDSLFQEQPQIADEFSFLDNDLNQQNVDNSFFGAELQQEPIENDLAQMEYQNEADFSQMSQSQEVEFSESAFSEQMHDDLSQLQSEFGSGLDENNDLTMSESFDFGNEALSDASSLDSSFSSLENNDFDFNDLSQNVSNQQESTFSQVESYNDLENFSNEQNEIASAIEVETDFDDEFQEPVEELITVRPVKFQQFEETEPIRAIKKNLDIMQDVSMHVSVELGRTKSSIRDVIEMDKGTIVELDKIAGEQVEIFVNGKLVAKGEVIVIEDKFGVRVTSTNIVKPEDVFN